MVKMLVTSCGRKAVAPIMSINGRFNSRRNMGLCKLFVKTIVTNTSVLQSKMVIYVRVPKTKTGYLQPGGRSSDCSVSCIAQLPSGSLVFIVWIPKNGLFLEEIQEKKVNQL